MRERIPVKSSFIESIGYEGGILEVAFKDGKVYRYEGISVNLYESLMGAESIGKAFRKNILEGEFGVEKVESEISEIE